MRQRVILSPATLEDVDYIVDIKTNVSLWPYEDNISSDRDEVQKVVTERIDSDWYKEYVIRLNNIERTSIGELHIHWYVKERKSWEIGYCIFPEYQGQGYCIEAARLALKHAFENWNAHKVVAMCNEYNTASYHVMESIGMKKEAIFREELQWQGRWVNQLFYCILDYEYRKMINCN